MTRIQWGVPRLRTYELGVDRGVLFPNSGPGVVWSGLTRVEEMNANQSVEDEFFDGRKFKTSISPAEFQAKIYAYSTPKEFMPCDGLLKLAPGFYAGNQGREKFGFSYRTLVGNQPSGETFGYRIHVIYNAIAIPDQKQHASMAGVMNPELNSWTIKTIPFRRLDYAWFSSPDGTNLTPRGSVYRPVSHVVVDSSSVSPQNLSLFEDLLYGTDVTEPQLPTPIEMAEMIR